MSQVDVLGFKLDEGLTILKNHNYDVKIYETIGLNKNFTKDLDEPRIIKCELTEDIANIIVSYF